MKIQILTDSGKTKRAIVSSFFKGSHLVIKAPGQRWTVGSAKGTECSNELQVKLNDLFDCLENDLDKVKLI